MSEEKEVLLSVSHLKKYFKVGRNATLKAVDVNRCNQSYDSFLQLHNKEVQRLSSLITPSSMGIKHIA